MFPQATRCWRNNRNKQLAMLGLATLRIGQRSTKYKVIGRVSR
jgi:hypothetical protein